VRFASRPPSLMALLERWRLGELTHDEAAAEVLRLLARSAD